MNPRRNSTGNSSSMSSKSADSSTVPDNEEKLSPYVFQETHSSSDNGLAACLEAKRRRAPVALGHGLPHPWNEVLPSARYPGHHFSEELIRNWGNKKAKARAAIWREPSSILPLEGSPFVPYVEKKTWQPLAPARVYLDERGIDLHIIRNWITICARLHGTRCSWRKSRDLQEPAGPIFLVDVNAMNLVRAEPEMEYVALSYIWGKYNAPCLTPENLTQFMEKGAFNSQALSGFQLIRDATQLVRDLGGFYLWIDRYCIPQGDDFIMQSQLDAMDSIFAGAWFSIIGAQNDDPENGLCGARKVFIGKTTSKLTSIFRSRKRIKIKGGYLTNEEAIMLNAWTLMSSRWHSRGWTFQEHFLSTRRILFHNDTIGWECNLASWHESQDLSRLIRCGLPSEIATSKESDVVRHPSLPDMFRYARLVSMYNHRDLTYPEDVLNAFRGVLSFLSQNFDGRNISGLPETFFNATLLWQPWAPMTRRKAKLQREDDSVLPSWSWVGWAGITRPGSWRAAYSYMYYRRSNRPPSRFSQLQVISTVEWHYSERLEGEHHRISDTSQDYQRLLDKPERLEELGWIRCRDDNSGNTYYRHQSMPTQRFWYPIPIPSKPQMSNQLISARFLHGRTRVATFHVGERFTPKGGDCDAVGILDSMHAHEESTNSGGGECVGFLRLNLMIHSRIRHLTATGTSTFELVELSAGSFISESGGDESFEELERLALPKGGHAYEFYNVLWVGWKSSPNKPCKVGYRRALGRIRKDAWDAVAKYMDVTLG